VSTYSGISFYDRVELAARQLCADAGYDKHADDLVPRPDTLTSATTPVGEVALPPAKPVPLWRFWRDAAIEQVREENERRAREDDQREADRDAAADLTSGPANEDDERCSVARAALVRDAQRAMYGGDADGYDRFMVIFCVSVAGFIGIALIGSLVASVIAP